MSTVFAIAVSLGFLLMLLLGLLSVLRELMDNTHDEPVFKDIEDAEAKSQFAWQSRPRSPAED